MTPARLLREKVLAIAEGLEIFDGNKKFREFLSADRLRGKEYRMSNQSTPVEAYYDRNQTVMPAAQLAMKLGYTTGVKADATEPGWTLLYIDLPTGQISWHIPDDEMLGDWQLYAGTWDGHSVEEKRRRIIGFLCV